MFLKMREHGFGGVVRGRVGQVRRQGRGAETAGDGAGGCGSDCCANREAAGAKAAMVTSASSTQRAHRCTHLVLKSHADCVIRACCWCAADAPRQFSVLPRYFEKLTKLYYTTLTIVNYIPGPESLHKRSPNESIEPTHGWLKECYELRDDQYAPGLPFDSIPA